MTSTYSDPGLSPIPRSPSKKAGQPVKLVVDAVRDQYGQLWYGFGNPKQPHWASGAELTANERSAVTKIATVIGRTLLKKGRAALLTEVEDLTVTKTAMVAARPGWIDGQPIYVMGNGTIIGPPNAPRIIVGFEPIAKFTPSGVFGLWKSRVGSVVTDQPLALFVLSLSLCGPMLRFVATSTPNPLCELVTSEPEKGKTTLAMLAASVWAGDRDNNAGGCESWDHTPGYLDRHKERHADGFLALDEGSHLGIEKAKQFAQAIFKLASTAGTKRYTDDRDPLQARLAVLSTSNTPLTRILGTGTSHEAMASRLVTIEVPPTAPARAPRPLADGLSDIESRA